jgi:hypothetical protein
VLTGCGLLFRDCFIYTLYDVSLQPAPCSIDTPFLPSAGIEDIILKKLLSSYSAPRLETPAELAPLYVDLAAVDKKFVTESI